MKMGKAMIDCLYLSLWYSAKNFENYTFVTCMGFLPKNVMVCGVNLLAKEFCPCFKKKKQPVNGGDFFFFFWSIGLMTIWACLIDAYYGIAVSPRQSHGH